MCEYSGREHIYLKNLELFLSLKVLILILKNMLLCPTGI